MVHSSWLPGTQITLAKRRRSRSSDQPDVVGALGDVTGDDQPVVRRRGVQRLGDRLVAGMTRVQVADCPEVGAYNRSAYWRDGLSRRAPADSLFGLVTTVFRKARRSRLAVLHILSGVTGMLDTSPTVRWLARAAPAAADH